MKIVSIYLTVFSIVLFLGFGILVFLYDKTCWRRGFLVLIAGTLGFALQFQPFDITSALNSMMTRGNFAQVVDLLVILLLSTFCISIFHLKDKGLSHPLIYPKIPGFSLSEQRIGLSLALGAFIFGIGMQLASRCAIGALVGIGEGSLRCVIILIFFIIGSTAATINPVFHWWDKLPSTKPCTLHFAWILLILVVLMIICLVAQFLYRRYKKALAETNVDNAYVDLQQVRWLMTVGVEKEVEEKRTTKQVFIHLLFDLLIAVCLSIFFAADGRVMSVMSGFTLIGAYILKLFKIDLHTWDYFSEIDSNPLNYDVLVTDICIMLGAFLATRIRSNFGSIQKTWHEYVFSIFGGLLMGFGGCMSYGCTIESMVSGINSCSLHGFVWLACATCGSGVICVIPFIHAQYKESKRRKRNKYEEI